MTNQNFYCGNVLYLTMDEVSKRVREMEIYTNRDIAPGYDNITAGRIFAHVFQDTLRYNSTRKSWAAYDGKRWVQDADTTSEKYAEMLARALLQDAASTALKDYQTFAFHLQERGGMGGRNMMLADGLKHLAVLETDFDAKPRYFNTLNCVLDLESMTIAKHDPGLLLSKISNVTYESDADSRIWNNFIRSIMDSNFEKDGFLQEALGYQLLGTNESETSFFLYGPSTRNGKTTLSETTRFLMGDYGGTINPETLAVQRTSSGSAASPDIAGLYGLRFVQVSEPQKSMLLDAAKYKALTGRQEISARFLHRNPFSFSPGFVLFLNGNYLPRVTDDTVFSSDRVHVITFDHHFSRAERDIQLKTKLRDPENLSAALNWMLSGLYRYKDRGHRFEPPDCVVQAVDLYHHNCDKMRLFFEDCLQANPGSNVSVSELYPKFTAWCEDNGFGAESKGGFIAALKQKGLWSETGTVNGRTIHNVVKGFCMNTQSGTDHEAVAS